MSILFFFLYITHRVSQNFVYTFLFCYKYVPLKKGSLQVDPSVWFDNDTTSMEINLSRLRKIILNDSVEHNLKIAQQTFDAPLVSSQTLPLSFQPPCFASMSAMGSV